LPEVLKKRIRLLNNKASLLQIKELLGHNNIQTLPRLQGSEGKVFEIGGHGVYTPLSATCTSLWLPENMVLRHLK
jgi:hypothetical protein